MTQRIRAINITDSVMPMCVAEFCERYKVPQVKLVSPLGETAVLLHSGGTFLLRGDRVKWYAHFTGSSIVTPVSESGQLTFEDAIQRLVDNNWRVEVEISDDDNE
ncbi:MAG: hypothetical protein NC218_08075 [Acetobacter sp.]|nr:hypothetical protein [Acetobacter sp.]